MASSRHRAAPAAHQEQRHRTEPEAAPRLPTQLPTKAANEPETACGKISLTLNIWVPWLLSKGTQTGKIMAGWIALFLASYSRKFLTPPQLLCANLKHICFHVCISLSCVTHEMNLRASSLKIAFVHFPWLPKYETSWGYLLLLLTWWWWTAGVFSAGMKSLLSWRLSWGA